MDETRARELLARERTRIEEALASLGRPLESDDQIEPGDRDSASLYQDELDQGRAEDLRNQMATLERAEGRLAAGTYGISVQSGKPIPDSRLEALPLAERTVEEERSP
jgi:DnaK suppressor protein